MAESSIRMTATRPVGCTAQLLGVYVATLRRGCSTSTCLEIARIKEKGNENVGFLDTLRCNVSLQAQGETSHREGKKTKQ